MTFPDVHFDTFDFVVRSVAFQSGLTRLYHALRMDRT